MKSQLTRKRQRNSIARNLNRGRPSSAHPLQLEHLEPRWLLNGSSLVSWDPPAALNTNAAVDTGNDYTPQLATDSAGNWIAVWYSLDSLGGTIGEDGDILFSRSVDDGRTWTDPAPLNTNAATDSGADRYPQLTTDCVGNWIAVWASYDSLGGIIGEDSDILISRSMDLGLTWTNPAPLNTNAATDSGTDSRPQLTTDRAGNCICVWHSTDSLNGTIGEDWDILFSRSTDAGLTWTAPAPLNANASADAGDDNEPALTTDSAGNWVAVWRSSDNLGGAIGDDLDILFARSTDAGLTWTVPAPLNTNAAADSGDDRNPVLATDTVGNWIAVWHSWDSLGGTIGEDSDILFSRSTDAGENWTAPAPLNTNAATDSGGDGIAELSTDSTGNWIAVWQSDDSLGGTIGTDHDIVFSRSIDAGLTWSGPLPANTNAATDSITDLNPTITTDGDGTWIAAWFVSVATDNDILFSRGTILDVTTLFADSFEYGQWNALWVEDSQNDWFTSTQRATEGSYSAEVDGSASNATVTIAAPIDLTPYGSAELSFDWLIESGLDTGEYLALDFYDGTSWQEVARLSGNVDVENAWHHPVLELDAEYLVNNFQFRFRAKMSGSDEDANVDNVQLIGIGVAGPPNQLPVAVDDAATTAEDNAVIINVLSNDSDPDAGDVLQVAEVTQGAHGSVVDNGNGTVTYTPSPNFHGSDSFSYTLSDGRGGEDTATVSVTVDPVNDPPVAANDSYTTDRDTLLNTAAPGVLGNDSDVDGDSVSAVPWSGTTANGGSVTLNGDGSFTYTPPAGFTGTDTFSYSITDSQLNGGPATVSIQVLGGDPNALYVYDIRFESMLFGRYWRAVFEIRSDSNADGQGGAADNVAAGVSITVEFAGQTYTGVTDSSGVLRTSWIKNLSSGDHYAEVVDLVLTGYYWNPLTLDLEDDTDGDGKPDNILHR